jgi:uncharacterized protein (TIGR03118 family)
MQFRLSRLTATFVLGVVICSASARAAANVYYDTVLVANRAEFAPKAFVDPHLVNPWGIALRPPGIGGHIWISNAGDISTTTYIGDVNGKTLYQDGLKIVPIDGGQTSPGGHNEVTGQVYNAASDVPGQPVEFFTSGPGSNLSSGTPVPIGTLSGPAKFIFVTLDGTINAWRASTAASMNTAVVMKDYSFGGPDFDPSLHFTPAYTGVALETSPFTVDGGGAHVADNRLYVTDFQNKRIQTFNNQWQEITASVPFERPSGIPEDYSPFNIQYLDGHLYVAYALFDPNSEERATDVPGEGAGHIVVYDRDGHIVREFADAGRLNSPWGMVIAPASFGAFGGCLLVANFGDGTIAAFDKDIGDFKGYLQNSKGENISIDGIWGLTFGNGVSLGDANALYYTAGPNTEQDGLFGRITTSPDPESSPTPTPTPTPISTPMPGTPAVDKPPIVRVLGKTTFATTLDRVQIEGTASDDHAVASVSWRVNGGDFRSAKGTAHWTITAPLRAGKNTVLIRSTDDAGQASEPVRCTITRK